MAAMMAFVEAYESWWYVLEDVKSQRSCVLENAEKDYA